MYQLNYHSKSKLGLELEDLDNILAKANIVNSERNITGCLIYHNKSFVQILEGHKNDVLQVFEKIKNDQRHHTITLLWENNVEDRFFTEWNMAYHKPNSESIKEYINNLLLLSMLSDKSKASLLSFWTSVRRILSDK
ncbi:BLUF domain-containing protein [Winogradskyella pacifica]|uniref:FAD-dependent sensor of blue light n=1 Tax=Winogradskyella pacifica TaxID=664642 RepID=A0A3D9LKP3_9FLAO|nr:BLUF domain-containing protein [Winogradskyella pacifica]REE07938.1 FAD-dependent sensor of blue light [Winogradskyella pacifica]